MKLFFSMTSVLLITMNIAVANNDCSNLVGSYVRNDSVQGTIAISAKAGQLKLSTDDVLLHIMPEPNVWINVPSKTTISLGKNDWGLPLYGTEVITCDKGVLVYQLNTLTGKGIGFSAFSKSADGDLIVSNGLDEIKFTKTK